jgi:hypothetical protein
MWILFWKQNKELREFPEQVRPSIREITNRIVEQHGEDYERKITPHWIGHIVRRKLGIKTYRRAGSYFIAQSERTKLERLFERYGLLAEDAEARTSGLPGLPREDPFAETDAKAGA